LGEGGLRLVPETDRKLPECRGKLPNRPGHQQRFSLTDSFCQEELVGTVLGEDEGNKMHLVPPGSIAFLEGPMSDMVPTSVISLPLVIEFCALCRQ
jgi:hypothetical protein